MVRDDGVVWIASCVVVQVHCKKQFLSLQVTQQLRGDATFRQFAVPPDPIVVGLVRQAPLPDCGRPDVADKQHQVSRCGRRLEPVAHGVPAARFVAVQQCGDEQRRAVVDFEVNEGWTVQHVVEFVRGTVKQPFRCREEDVE